MDWITIIGFLITFAGFAATLYQIFKVKSTAEQIEAQVESTQKKIQKVLAISDIATCIETIKMIYSDLKNEQYELAHFRILEINSLVIELKEVPSLDNIKAVKDLEAFGKYLTADLLRVQNLIYVEKVEVDKDTKETIIKNLNEISNVLSKINAQLKHCEIKPESDE